MTFLIAVLLAASHPCMDDARKLCQGIQPGQGRIAACLESHEAELSAACKAKRAEFREEVEACQADVQRLCPQTKPGPERSACMREHKDQVSAECRELFAKVKEGRAEAREAMQACRADAQKLCKDVKPGRGRIVECLKQHDQDISPACAEELKQAQH
jgi:chromosome segregation ATPase